MQSRVSRRLAVWVCLTLGLLALALRVAHRSIEAQVTSSHWVTRSHQVTNELEQLVTLLTEGETGQRGYLLTGDRAYLEPLEGSSRQVDAHFDSLFTLTADNPAQQARLRRLKGLAYGKLEELQQTIGLYDTRGAAAALEVVLSGRGQKLMGDLRQQTREVRHVEDTLLAQHESRARAAVWPAIIALDTLAAVLVTAFIISLLGATREAYRRRQAVMSERDAERRFRAVFDQTFQLVGMLAPDGTLLEVNQAALTFGGLSRGDVVGRPFWETRWWGTDARAQERLRKAISEVAAGGYVRYEAEHVAADGTAATIDFSLKPMTDESGRVTLLIAAGHDITERKKNEVALRESEARFQAYMGVSPAGSYAKDADGRYLYVNPRVLQLLGGELADWLGKTDAELWSEEEATVLRENDLKALASDRSIEVFETVTGDDGVARKWLSYKFPFITSTGHRLLGGMSIDITDRLKAEEALRESERRFRTILDSAYASLVMLSPDGTVQEANRTSLELSGSRREDLIGHPFWETSFWQYDPANGQVMKEAIGRAARGESSRMELEVHTFPGQTRFKDVKVTPVQEDAGSVVSIIYQSYDLTERKRAEREAAELASIVHSSDDGIIGYSFDGVITTWNHGAERLFGYTAGEAVGQSMDLLVPDGELSDFASILDMIWRGERVESHEARRKTKDGRLLDVSLTISPMFDTDGRVVGASKIARDITEQKRLALAVARANEKIKESEQKLQTILDRLTSSVYVMDITGRYVWVNSRASGVFGCSPDVLLGKSLSELLDPETARSYTERNRRFILENQYSEYEDTFTIGGKARTFFIADQVLTDERGEPAFLMSNAMDITARKQAEEDLRVAKEAAEAASRAKADFLANMSHEIRTPMNGVIGATGLLLTTELSAEQRDLITTIRESGTVLLSLINDILDYSKIEAGQLAIEAAPFDLRRLLQDTLEVVAPTAFARGLQPIVMVPPGMHSWYSGDASRIRQVLLNYLSNALKFTPEGGEVILSALAVPAGEGVARIRLAVRDTGIGVPHGRQAAIFERFTQAESGTARTYGGTGLGLAICERLAGLMGGSVGLDSEPGRGSTFWLDLDLPTCGDAEGHLLDTGALAGCRVLVADGSHSVRAVICEQLRSWGARPQESADAADVIGLLRSAGPDGAFVAVLLDARLPGAGASELARALAADPRTAPVARVLLREGTLGTEGLNRSGHFAAVLAKPVRPSSLYDTLVTILRGASPIRDRPAGVAAPAARFDGTRVLLVEDNPTNKKVALWMLERLGCVADAVGDGREALEMLGRVNYDLVLMDLQMPGMDGFEATAEIRHWEARAGGGRRRVIAMTANALQGDRERCLAAGMDDYLPKPVTLDGLAGMLEKWRPDGPDLASETAVAGKDRPVPLDRGRLAEITGGNPVMEPELIGCFLDDAKELLARARKGLEGTDAREVREAAHGLHGICRTFGAEALGDTAREVERAARGGDLSCVGESLSWASRQFEEIRTILRNRLEQLEGSTELTAPRPEGGM